MEKKLSKNQDHLKAFDKQRKAWLILSVVVVIILGEIIFNWASMTSSYLIWALATCGFFIAIIWWYWTMRLMHQLIDHRIEESKILQEIVIDIKDIKKEIKETMLEIVDKSK